MVDAAIAGEFEIVTSPPLLDELVRVLRYPRLEGVVGDVAEVVGLLALVATVVEPTVRLDLARDPDDNRVLEAALAAEADVIVTGDADLLELDSVDSVQLVTPSAFLELLKGEGAGPSPGGV